MAAFSLGAKLLFSFGPGDLESLDEEMDKAGQKDPEEEEGGTKYVFVMPQDDMGGGPERSNNNMDTRSVNGTQEDTPADGSKIRPKNLDVEMELRGSREDEDTISLLYIRSKGVIQASLTGLRCHVSGVFPGYAGSSTIANTMGWSNITTPHGKYGSGR